MKITWVDTGIKPIVGHIVLGCMVANRRCNAAERSVCNPFIKLTKQIRIRLNILLNWFKYHISNAKAEAVNNVIKSLLILAYGYKDFEFF